MNAVRWFWVSLLVTGVCRVWLTVSVPITSDEAYFLLWGRAPDWGYYDHPPMVGWWHALLAQWGEALWVIRLPALLLPMVLAVGVRWVLVRWFQVSHQNAWLAGAMMLLLPMHVWNVLITTDTPLVLMTFLSMVLFARAAQQNDWRMFVWAGVALGGAFLSKYFAVLAGMSMLVWAITTRTAGLRWLAVLLVFCAALPAGLLNLWWNVHACWSNIMFNAINRHEHAGLNLMTPSLYVAALLYLAAPLFWMLWRERIALRAASLANPAFRTLLLAWVVPLLIFAALAPIKKIGLHWLLSFMPALILCAAMVLRAEQLRTVLRVFVVIALLHGVLAVTIALTPLSRWQETRWHPRLVFLLHADTLVKRMTQPPHVVLATDNYSASAVLAYHAKQTVAVFGPGTSHARQDDIQTDWRKHDGRDLVIFRRELPPIEEYAPYFDAVRIEPITIEGAQFYLVHGQGFRYTAYRDGVLQLVRERWYRIPSALPIASCYFCERYFPGGPCVR